MDKALQRVSQLCNNSDIPFFHKQFERLQRMPGANRLFGRIASSSNRDQLEDYLAEVRYALVCAGLGFQVAVEPFGSKGPDLSISRDGHRAIVEIMRFRKIYPGPPQLGSSDENLRLPEYGSPPRDIRKAFEKFLAKFPQVAGEQAIIAIWNDDGDLEELEVRTAVNDLCNDADRGIQVTPAWAIICLVWLSVGTRKRSATTLLFSVASLQINWITSHGNENLRDALSGGVFNAHLLSIR